jgi:hypothetical protein
VLVEKRKLERGESMKDGKRRRMGGQTEEDRSKQKRKQTRG